MMIVINRPSRVVVGAPKDEAEDSYTRRELKQAAEEAPPPVPRHELVVLGDGQSPIEHARAVLEHVKRLTTYRGHPWLDGAYATPRAIVLAANGVLKAEGLPQIGKRAEWLV